MEDHANASTYEDVVLFMNLVRCETRLYNAVDQRLRAAHGLGAGSFEFLRLIRDHAGTRVADLAAAFAISVGVTSKVVDRLEAQGLVVRRPNPANRRSSLLALTEKGAELLAAAERTFVNDITQHFAAALAPDEIAALATTLGVLRTSLEKGNIGIPPG